MAEIALSRKIKFGAAAGLAAAVAVAGFGYRHFSRAGPDHRSIRAFEIRLKLSAVSDPVVFIGDSITEGAPLPAKICDRSTIDAGIGGFDAAAYSLILDKIGNFRAAAIVVALGTNDARRNHIADFLKDYQSLVQALEPRSPTLILAGVPPIEDGSFSEWLDKGRAGRINKDIAAIARQRGHRFVDLGAALSGRRVTKDGVHLSPTGYSLWVDALRTNVAAALVCKNNSGQ
jgi:GDSL-like Lipase/Acylhydrolase family